MAGSTPAKVGASAEDRQPCAGALTAGMRGLAAAERVLLLDAAMRSWNPITFLRGVESAFDRAGRESDVLLASVIRVLLASGEIETLMFMRAEWLGRHPAVRRRVRRHG